MNIYARYFDQDILVYSIDELVEFLSGISDIQVTRELVEDIRSYVEGDMPYPKRYKIRPRVYFILIKTTASSLEEFKSNKRQGGVNSAEADTQNRKEARTTLLAEELPGWYRGTITFKRVMLIPGTGKFQYQDTVFSALVMAVSGIDCYNRIVDYLKNRQDVDLRSQFPSARGNNFEFEFIGSVEDVDAADVMVDVQEEDYGEEDDIEQNVVLPDYDDQSELSNSVLGDDFANPEDECLDDMGLVDSDPVVVDDDYSDPGLEVDDELRDGHYDDLY